MPPKKRITKELILQKAFEIIHEEGIESLNARYLAKQLNCSTMPIFQSFQDMRDLKMELSAGLTSTTVRFLTGMCKKRITCLRSALLYQFCQKRAEFLWSSLRKSASWVSVQSRRSLILRGTGRQSSVRPNSLKFPFKKVKACTGMSVFMPMELRRSFMEGT